MAPRSDSVLALDLSLAATGWATSLTVHGLITTSPRQPDEERWEKVRDAVEDLASRHDIDLAVVEDLPTHAQAAGATGPVHGAVRLMLHDAGVRVVTVPPATLKKYGAGRGNATKADMRVALLERCRVDVRDDNEVDAIWLWLLATDLLGAAEVAMPKANRDALAKVHVPEGVR